MSTFDDRVMEDATSTTGPSLTELLDNYSTGKVTQ
jgi:hypothetical protein